MNCDKCLEQLSLFLDNDLDETSSMNVEMHLSACGECSKIADDFAAILGSCQFEPENESPLPPNSKALWLRINNVIENDARSKRPLETEAKKSWFSKSFSFSQAASAVVGIALISSLLTVVGIKNYFEPTADDFTTRSSATQTTFEKVLSRMGLSETPHNARMRRVVEQQSAIDYWNNRVQIRKAQWDNRMRDAFDRNLNEINQAVSEYSVILEKDPQDELSGEMLDSALNEKMNLLRAFADL